jgi:hypothetical protein
MSVSRETTEQYSVGVQSFRERNVIISTVGGDLLPRGVYWSGRHSALVVGATVVGAVVPWVLLTLLAAALGGCAAGPGPSGVFVLNDWQPVYLGTEHAAPAPMPVYPIYVRPSVLR